MPKPPLGKVAVGDQLTVIPASYSNRVKQKAAEATVTKIGRVWVDLAEVDGPRTWRLRLDTQMNSGNGTYRDRFLSREQYDWEQTIAAARAVLRYAQDVAAGRDYSVARQIAQDAQRLADRATSLTATIDVSDLYAADLAAQETDQ